MGHAPYSSLRALLGEAGVAAFRLGPLGGNHLAVHGARWSRILVASALLGAANDARADQDDGSAGRVTPAIAAGVWTLAQLLPSPLLVTGSHHVGGGVRWQITPFVYSFGVAARPVRMFIVDPIARHSGALELYASPEWACCAPDGGTGWIARAGGRLYVPLAGHGESLAASLGGSYYRASGGDGAALEVGAYLFFSIVGITVTVSPKLERREVISALTLRYF